MIETNLNKIHLEMLEIQFKNTFLKKNSNFIHFVTNQIMLYIVNQPLLLKYLKLSAVFSYVNVLPKCL